MHVLSQTRAAVAASSSTHGHLLTRASRRTSAVYPTAQSATLRHVPIPSSPAWLSFIGRLQLLRLLLSTPTPPQSPLFHVGASPLCRSAPSIPLRTVVAPLFTQGTAWTARRYAKVGRRPTFTEIAEALHVLGVTIDEDSKSLKKKYRELVKKNHPDAGGDEATMARVTVAYDRLLSLTKREKEEFKVHQKMFHVGGGGGGGAGSGSRRYRPGPPGGFGYAAPGGPFQGRAANMYGQYYQQDANSAYQQARKDGQEGFWNSFYNRAGSGGFAENPFASSSPFSMHAQAQRARFIPTGTLLVQGLVVYLVLSAFFLFLYRRYRDWSHDDGWRMSESLARHEQMQEMHRIRQEMNERAREMMRESAAEGGGVGSSGLLPIANALYGNRAYVGESAEARALEYARQRRIQIMQEQQEANRTAPELKGWPKIDEDKGRIIKRTQDPAGIVFFEPRKEDMRRRQIENQRRAAGFTHRNDAPLKSAATPQPTEAAAAAGASSSPPLPPETNVGAVTMKPVANEQEAQSVMRSIFGGLRRSAS